MQLTTFGSESLALTSISNSTSSAKSTSTSSSPAASTFSTTTTSSAAPTSSQASSAPPPTSTPSSPASPTLCSGNQVESDCIAGSLPSKAPYSGPQPPSCAKADGDSGTLPRINEKAASDAATTYCQRLITNGNVLSAQSQSVNPFVVNGVAENKAGMSLVVIFDVAGCPTDKSMSTVDFKKLGQDECFSNFYTVLSEVCAQDKTWKNYNADFSLEGGSYLNDYAIWSMSAGKKT